MNPSTEDMLNAIDQVNADSIFILPNNKNIVLAANQAKALVKDKEIIVIPTKTVPQGITAIINFVPDADAKTNEETMLEEIKNVKSGQVTYAVRDTKIDDKEIHEGDIMGIGDSGILAVGKGIEETNEGDAVPAGRRGFRAHQPLLRRRSKRRRRAAIYRRSGEPVS